MLLIINIWIHPKNKKGLDAMCNYLKLNYKYGSLNDLEEDTDVKYKIVYNPTESINIQKFDNRDGKRLWLFGPHFSIFPNYKLDNINFKQSNLFYLMPSQWCIDIWKNHFNVPINMITMPFPVDVDKFNEIYKINDINRDKVIIYYKRRNPYELLYLLNFCNNRGIDYKIFDYVKSYDENDFLNYIHKCKYAIILDAGESQGFAIQEMMSCNVPMLVWSITDLSQEYSENSYSSYRATTIPYWDNICGEVFYEIDELEKTYQLFINKLGENLYNPRKFILNNLDVSNCSNRFYKLLTTNLIRSICQDKKGQEQAKNGDYEIQKLDKILTLVRDPEEMKKRNDDSVQKNKQTM